MIDQDLRVEARRLFANGVASERARANGQPEPSGLTLSAQPVEDVWIATGLVKRWRVVSEYRTYGEWDDLTDALLFLQLLVDGNDNLQRIG